MTFLVTLILCRASDDRFNPLHQLALADRPDLGCGDLAILEQHEGGDAAHAVLLRGLRIVVDVDLGDVTPPFLFAAVDWKGPRSKPSHLCAFRLPSFSLQHKKKTSTSKQH